MVIYDSKTRTGSCSGTVNWDTRTYRTMQRLLLVFLHRSTNNNKNNNCNKKAVDYLSVKPGKRTELTVRCMEEFELQMRLERVTKALKTSYSTSSLSLSLSLSSLLLSLLFRIYTYIHIYMSPSNTVETDLKKHATLVQTLSEFDLVDIGERVPELSSDLKDVRNILVTGGAGFM
jgi:hypothetical protein